MRTDSAGNGLAASVDALLSDRDAETEAGGNPEEGRLLLSTLVPTASAP